MSTETNLTAQAENALSALSQAIAVFHAQLGTANQRKEVLRNRRMALYTAPLKQEDIVKSIGELIDKRAETYIEMLRKHDWAQKLSEPYRGIGKVNKRLTLEDVESMHGKVLEIPRRNDPAGDLWNFPIFLQFGEFEVSWIYFILGDVLKERLSMALEEIISDGSNGFQSDMPSMEARRQEIAAINVELAELDIESARLRAEISKLSTPVLSSAYALKIAAEAA